MCVASVLILKVIFVAEDVRIIIKDFSSIKIH